MLAPVNLSMFNGLCSCCLQQWGFPVSLGRETTRFVWGFPWGPLSLTTQLDVVQSKIIQYLFDLTILVNIKILRTWRIAA